MKNIELHTFVILSLVMLTLATISVSARNHQEFIHNDNYVMQEPFSSAPLVTYPSLEASGVDS
jgi:hypothetical protein